MFYYFTCIIVKVRYKKIKFVVFNSTADLTHEKEQYMPKLLEVYKCALCGNIVEVVHAGGGELVCCGEAMGQLTENTVDAAKEKHVPVIEKVAGGYKVTIGSVAHPMEEKHYIEWIELVADGKAYRQFLKPGEVATTVFCVEASSVTARELCNLHGLWSATA
jgi:superoxide reductase